MIEHHLNNFDYAVLGIMALSCLFAFFRGLVREVLSLAAWVGAGIFTLTYFAVAAEKLQPHFKSPMVAAAIATVGLYLGALIALSIINRIIIKTIKGGGDPGMLDNLLGLGFGALRGALILSFGFFLFTVTWPQKDYPDWLETSLTRPYIEKGALWLAAAAPGYLRDVAALQKKAVDKMRAHQEEDNAYDRREREQEEDTGYSPQANRQLNRLIDSANPDQRPND